MAQHFGKKVERRRGRHSTRNRLQRKHSESQLKRLLPISSVEPSAIFGVEGESILDDLASTLPAELIKPLLGRVKSMLPPPTAPFAFAPQSSSDEEEVGHADVSEFEHESSGIHRRRGPPMKGITIIPESNETQRSFFKPQRARHVTFMDELEIDDDDAKKSNTAGQDVGLIKGKKRKGVSKKNQSQNSNIDDKKLAERRIESSGAKTKVVKSGQLEEKASTLAYFRPPMSNHRRVQADSASNPRPTPQSMKSRKMHQALSSPPTFSPPPPWSGWANRIPLLKKSTTPSSPPPPVYDAKRIGAGWAKPTFGYSKGRKVGNWPNRSTLSSAHLNFSSGAQINRVSRKSGNGKGGSSKEEKETSSKDGGSKGENVHSTTGNKGGRALGVASGDEADVDTEWEGGTRNRTRGWGRGRGLSSSGYEDCLSDGSATSSNTYGSLGTYSSSAGESVFRSAPPANPLVRFTRHLKKRRALDSKEEDDKEREEYSSSSSRKGETKVKKMETEKEIRKERVDVNVDGHDDGDPSRPRPKRRKINLSELCLRLGKLEMQHSKQHSKRGETRPGNASFLELVSVLPDLVRDCNVTPWGNIDNKPVKIFVSRPRISGDPPVLQAGHCAVASPCGPIFLSPSGHLTLLDVTRAATHGSKWVRLPELPVRSLHYSTARLLNTSLLVFGGASRSRKLTSNVYVFSLPHGRWVNLRTRGSPPAPRVHHVAVDISGDHLLVHGGTANNHILSDTYRLHVRLGRWSRCRCQNSPSLAYHSADLYGSHVVVFGGTDGRRVFNSIYTLSLKTMVWSELSPKGNGKRPCARMAHSSTILGDRLFIMGGHNPLFGPEHSLVDIWSFHFPSRTWQAHTPCATSDAILIPVSLPRHLSASLTFVHHTPSLLPSMGFGVFTLLLVGIRPVSRRYGSNGGSTSSDMKSKGKISATLKNHPRRNYGVHHTNAYESMSAGLSTAPSVSRGQTRRSNVVRMACEACPPPARPNIRRSKQQSDRKVWENRVGDKSNKGKTSKHATKSGSGDSVFLALNISF